MSELQPFEGATNRTSIFVLQKGQPTRYPVTYTYWKKEVRGKGLDYDSTLEEVMALTRRLNFQALPVNADDPTSAWLTGRERALRAVQKVLGVSDYTAHAGVTTWANGVYWLEIVATRPDSLLVVRNVTEEGKREVEPVVMEIEPDLVYPLLRIQGVSRWCAESSASILMVQDPLKRQGISEEELQRQWPKTWVYLKRFEPVLRKRSGFKRYFTRKDSSGHTVETGPFYSMFNVGESTFAPYKVVWPNMGDRLDAAVISEVGGKSLLPQHIVSLAPFEKPDEAHYVCACVNSVSFRFAAHSYSQSGGKSFATPQILENLRIPKYENANPTHQRLAELSRRAHELAAAGDKKALQAVEDEVDQAAAELWGITAEEQAEIRRSLEELRG